MAGITLTSTCNVGFCNFLSCSAPNGDGISCFNTVSADDNDKNASLLDPRQNVQQTFTISGVVSVVDEVLASGQAQQKHLLIGARTVVSPRSVRDAMTKNSNLLVQI